MWKSSKVRRRIRIRDRQAIATLDITSEGVMDVRLRKNLKQRHKTTSALNFDIEKAFPFKVRSNVDKTKRSEF